MEFMTTPYKIGLFGNPLLHREIVHLMRHGYFGVEVHEN